MAKNQKNISSESLVAQYQQGNKDALKLLINRYHSKIISAITYYTNSSMPIDDLAQECWIDIIQKLPELNLKISFEAWAHTIAKRRSIDWIREQQRMRKRAQALKAETTNTEEMDEATEPVDEMETIRTGIIKLPATQRMVLRMFYLDNLSLLEISDVLDVPEGTVKSRLYHAREKLKSIIKSINEETQ